MKKLRALIFGSTGMVGKGVLIECLESPLVESIVTVNRHNSGSENPKVTEILTEDFFDFTSLEKKLEKEIKKINACFFTLGISSAGLNEEKYSRVTLDLTLGIARLLKKMNPDLTLIYVSGSGTDSSESGKMMWARVKGKTENSLLSMGFSDAYMFRPGFIQPMKGIKSKTRLYRIIYNVFKPLYSILKYFPSVVTTTEEVGRAMIKVASDGYDKKILENRDIHFLGKIH